MAFSILFLTASDLYVPLCHFLNVTMDQNCRMNDKSLNTFFQFRNIAALWYLYYKMLMPLASVYRNHRFDVVRHPALRHSRPLV